MGCGHPLRRHVPWYGRGLSELRTGAGPRCRPRDEYVLSSKVGRWFDAARSRTVPDLSPWVAPAPFLHYHDCTHDGVMRSYEQSQLHLGMAWCDVGVIHDLDFRKHETEEMVQQYLDQLKTSGWPALEELRRSGLLKAAGAVPGARSDYRSADEATRARVRRIEAPYARHGVPIAAAALQFVMGHPVLAAVIPGAAAAAQVERNGAATHHPVPADLWTELKHERLLREDAPVAG